ncbi:MAG TPA: hypothetical protein VFS20_27565 [Longimicrobium sp.]|nr:hypothetical protein [Longimicrobium sp.]
MIEEIHPSRPARSVPPRAWRWPVLPLLATILAAGGCGGANDDTGDPDSATPASAPASAPAAAPAGDEAAAPPPGLAAPDPLEVARDSMQEAELYRQRQQSMESYESCMRKARGLDPPQRAMIETACKRLPTAPR